MKNQCEGWIRYGGVFTLGVPEWKQCKNEGIVIATIENKDGDKHTGPLCNDCWQRVIQDGLKIEVTRITQN